MTFNDLPIEIITQVFAHFIKAQQPSVGRSSIRSCKADFSGPLTLSAICRSLRDITIGTPNLWTSLNFQITHSTNMSISKSSAQREILGIWLDCSRDLPLHISLLGAGDDSDPNFDPRVIAPMFALLKAHSERWESLQLVMPWNAYPVFFQGLAQAPSLRRIALDPGWAADWEPFDVHLSGSMCPRLQELRISDHVRLLELNIVWDNLTVLEMQSRSIGDILEALRRVSRLKRCVIDISQYPFEQASSLVTTSISQTSLQDLELRSSGAEYLEFVVGCLTLPSLQRFSYWDSSSSTTKDGPFRGLRLNHLHDLFTRSRCQLKRLEIIGMYGSKEHKQLVEVLECQPYIEHLTLGRHPCSVLSGWHIGWLSDEFFTHHAEFATLSRLLPRLKTLRITGMQGFSWDTLLTFLNRAHLHITRTGMGRISIRILLVQMGKQGYEDEYISLPVVSELAERKWEQIIDLSIVRDLHKDLIKASLVHHGLEPLLARWVQR